MRGSLRHGAAAAAVAAAAVAATTTRRGIDREIERRSGVAGTLGSAAAAAAACTPVGVASGARAGGPAGAV